MRPSHIFSIWNPPKENFSQSPHPLPGLCKLPSAPNSGKSLPFLVLQSPSVWRPGWAASLLAGGREPTPRCLPLDLLTNPSWNEDQLLEALAGLQAQGQVLYFAHQALLPALPPFQWLGICISFPRLTEAQWATVRAQKRSPNSRFL